MAVIYKPIQAILANKEGKKLYHPRVVYVANVGTNQLAKEVAEYSSLSTGDVKNTLDNLAVVMTKHMQASETVTLDGLGTFSLAFRSTGNGMLTAEEVDASKAYLHVRFKPCLTRNADRTVATRSLITGTKCVLYGSLVQPGEVTGGGSGGGNTGGDGGDSENPMG